MRSTFPAPRARRAAFTLIELLTVIAIIGILAAILIPTVGAVRAKGHSAKTASNLRQIQAANASYAAANRGFFVGNDPHGVNAWAPGWFAYRPFLEHLSVNGEWGGTNNEVLGWAWQNRGQPEILRCGKPIETPSFEGDGTGGDRLFTIAMNMTAWTHRQNGTSIPSSMGWGAFGFWTAGKISLDRVPYPSRLITFYESNDFYGWYDQRNDWVGDNGTSQRGLAYRNGGYANVVFADGSVGRFNRSQMEANTLANRRHWWVYGGYPGEEG